MSEATDAFPTEAEARERARRKAQKAAGKAHAVKRRVGKDLSSLIGKDQTLDTTWTDFLDEEVEELIHSIDGQDKGCGIEQVMIYGVVVWPANTQTVNKQRS